MGIDVDTAYRQVRDDVDGDIAVKGYEGTYLGFNGRTVTGTLDVWGAEALRIDGRDSDIGDGLVLWRGDAEKLDLGNSRAGHVILRDASIDTCWGARMDAGYVDVRDSQVEELILQDAVLDELVLDGSAVGRLDLGGAALGSIEADDMAGYAIGVDADTYLHDVPEALTGELGYRQVTGNERAVLDAVDRLGYRSEDPVDAETVAWYVEDVLDDAESPQQVHGTAAALVRKTMLDVEDGQYHLTPRGRSAHRFSRDGGGERRPITVLSPASIR